MGKFVRNVCVVPLIILLVIGLAGCPWFDEYPDIPAGRVFRAKRITDETWYDVSATRMAVGDHCIVYVENFADVDEATATAIATEYDANIYGMIRANFANESDVDDNGRVILLLLDIVDGYTAPGGYVAGYFDPTHLYSRASFTDSNQADMLFLDVNPAEAGSPEFYSTIAHEMQHLVNFNATVGDDGYAQDVWINEGLSSGAEYLYTRAQVQERIDYYNEDPAETIRYGNNFFMWNGYWEAYHSSHDVLADYSTVYLFFQWLQIHASNGTAIYKDILSSSSRDVGAVTQAAALRISSSFSSWSLLLRTWMEANLLNNATGYQGYLGEIATQAWFFNPTSGEPNEFQPGEGIASMIGGMDYSPVAGSGANIVYVGLTDVGVEDLVAPYTGDICLVFNASADLAYTFETGYLASSVPGYIPPPRVGGSGKGSKSAATKWPISVTLAPGGGLAPGSHAVK